MNKSIKVLILISVLCFLMGCKDKNLVMLPVEEESITLKTLDLIYINEKSTTHSLGEVDSSFTFSKDKLVVWNATNEETYDIKYEEVSLTNEEFREKFDIDYEMYDISSYKNIIQYNLCEATKDSPGYKMFVLGDQYWIATLYKNNIWRIVSTQLDDSK